MAVLQVIRNFLAPAARRSIDPVRPAPRTVYAVRPIAEKDLDELLRLNYRCFEDGENYTKHTFSYLLSQANALCCQVTTADGRMAAFLCVLIGEDGIGHITTIGVAPEHRRRGLGEKLLNHLNDQLAARGVSSVVLEVRIGNVAAQKLYSACGYTVVQRLSSYYNNGEDGFLMMKPVTQE